MKLSLAHRYVTKAIEKQIPVMLWGPPGIGKSSLIHQVSDDLNFLVEDLRLPQLDPTDIRGVPFPNLDTKRSVWMVPEFWPDRAKTDGERQVRDLKGNIITTKSYKAGQCPRGPGIIFLDEIEKAPISVKNAALQLVWDRKIGNYTLPSDWAIACAGNREEDNAFSMQLGTPLSNRMIHLEIEPDVPTWVTWARNNNIQEEIIEFVRFKPTLLYTQTNEHAFPSPRSWTIASMLIEGVEDRNDYRELVASAIGKATAGEFITWRSKYKDVDPEAILERGEMPIFDKSDAAIRYATAISVSHYLKKRKNGISNVEENIVKFLTVIGAELRVIFMKEQSSKTLEAMVEHEAFRPIVGEYWSVVS